jgi:hypothetical protein
MRRMSSCSTASRNADSRSCSERAHSLTTAAGKREAAAPAKQSRGREDDARWEPHLKRARRVALGVAADALKGRGILQAEAGTEVVLRDVAQRRASAARRGRVALGRPAGARLAPPREAAEQHSACHRAAARRRCTAPPLACKRVHAHVHARACDRSNSMSGMQRRVVGDPPSY